MDTGTENHICKELEKRNQKDMGQPVIKILTSGKKIHLDLDFDTQIDGWMADHWEITVTKIPKGCAGKLQSGAAHEFGHMLGLADEYKTSSKHVKDCASIMHSGSSTRPRHNSTMIKWLEKTLIEHGIK